MKLFLGTDDLLEPMTGYPVVAIGNFDGLHVGHQATLAHAIQRAKEKHGTSVVLTFRPHPSQILSPQKPALLLTSFEEKLRLLEALGIDAVVLVEFNKEFAHQTPRMFVQNLLVEKIGCKEIIVGEQFSFGKNRTGKIADLVQFGHEFGFTVTPHPVVLHEERPVSSSVIRALIQKGEVKQAAKLLSRPYSLSGEVIHADGRGTQLGFPTANLNPLGKLIPKEGVYAARVMLSQSSAAWNAAAYIGAKPTFQKEGPVQLEVHLFDFKGNLYGQQMEVAFIERIRPDKKFNDRVTLIKQIQQDMKKIQYIINGLA